MRNIFLFVLLGIQAGIAVAALGGAQSTFPQAQARVRAQVLASGTSPWRVSESTLASGTIVREYVGADGIVFAVSWSGPLLPDLQSLLGAHFATLTGEATSKPKAGHSQLRVAHPEVVIVSGGHMRAYEGRAWIPAALPAGFAPSDIE